MNPAARSAVRIAATLAIVVGIAWVVRPQSIVVETAAVARGALSATVSAEGKTRVRNLFVVAAPVDGELERIGLKQGDTVTSSTVVAVIRPAASRPLDPRSRAEATAAVAAARAGVQRAEATEREANAALSHAESAAQTSTRLASEGVVAAKEAEHSGHELDIRRQALTVSRAAVEQARAELVRAEAAAATPASSGSPATTPVRAPTSGRVLRVLHESGGPIEAGTPLLEIGNTNGLEITADFLTADAVKVRADAPATIRDWGGDAPLTARVRHVEPGAFTKVSALGLEEQRVSVVMDLVGERPAALGDAFHVNVDVEIWRGDNVITVPSTALFRSGNAWAVFVVRDGRAHLTTVVTGRSDGARTVVDRGLTSGEEIVLQPSDALADGARVRSLPTR